MVREMSDMKQKVKDYIIREFSADNPQITLDDEESLIKEGLIDSLGLFLLISFLEKEFQIKVGQEDIVLENFETVTAIKNYVMGRI